MHFGLISAPTSFQALVNNALWGFLNIFVFVWLDDILINSKDPEQYTDHLREVLQCLLEKQLLIKVGKYEFHISSLSLLGLIFEWAGLNGSGKDQDCARVVCSREQ